MNIINLEACLIKVNRQGFCRLDTDHNLLASHRTDSTQVYPVPASRTLLPSVAGPNFAGNTSGHTSKHDLEKLITLDSSSAVPIARVAIGAVIDSASSQPPINNDDLPVVLVAGINYGQQSGHDYVAAPPGLYDHSAMRPRLENAVGLLVPFGCAELTGEDYHLVAANFFPWITRDPWTLAAPNCITEQLLVRYFGWPSPLGFIALLIQQLQIASRRCKHGLTHIVFHGANNAVPGFGAALTSRANPISATAPAIPLYKNRHPLCDPHAVEIGEAGPHVIFCDNLAPGPAGPNVQNSVVLWQEPPPRQHQYDVMDEEE